MALFDAAVLVALIAAVVSAGASIVFLRIRDLSYDALAVAATEVGLAALAAGILLGAISAREAERWWTWDPRLTAALACFLLYASYLMLRHSIEEPSRRAASAAVVSLFAFFDVPIIVLAIHWWLAPRAEAAVSATAAVWWTAPAAVAAVLASALLVWIRLRREERRRAEDAARRTSWEI
jgi:heme exporter protein C